MIETIRKISNPLTIIAIFAGLAEIAGTIAIKLVEPQYQETFIWFVMLFPTLLVILFFITLFKKPQALYAPADFRADESYLSLQGLNKIVSEKSLKIQESQNDSKKSGQSLPEYYGFRFISRETKDIIISFTKKPMTIGEQHETARQILFKGDYSRYDSAWGNSEKVIMVSTYIRVIADLMIASQCKIKRVDDDKYMVEAPPTFLAQINEA